MPRGAWEPPGDGRRRAFTIPGCSFQAGDRSQRMATVLRTLVLLPVLLAVLGGTRALVRAGPAPQLRWQVEPNDFVHFRIVEEEVADSDARAGAPRADATDLEGFYGYELDSRGLRVVRPVTQEAWFAAPFVFRLPDAQVASRTRVEMDEEEAGTWRLGPVRARGFAGVERVEADGGGQRLVTNGLVLFEPIPGLDVSHYAYRRLVQGRLTWTSTFADEQGLMTRIVYDLQVRTAPTQLELPRGIHDLLPGERTLALHRVLELDRRYEHRFTGFQGRVDVAIERCCDWLEAFQRPDGSFPGMGLQGTTALALLALARSGRPIQGHALERGFDWLLEQDPQGTYEVAAVLMALEALGTPPEEMVRARRGELDTPRPCKLSPKARALAERCANYLLENALEAPRAGGMGTVTGRALPLRWGYPHRSPIDLEPDHPDWWDNSNTQYAVLGLNSAARCGVEIGPDVWRGIAEHFLAVQSTGGEDRSGLRLTPHARRKTEKGHRYAVDAVDAVRRGWSYGECGNGCRPYGSMTCAGLASLAIARARLQEGKRIRSRPRLLSRIDAAIRDGWAALEGMWTVYENPNFEGWYVYHLYGLERAGILCDVERLEGHDWYWEGALPLLLRQEVDGSWPTWSAEPVDTIWALLFLSRSTTPITPR